MVLVAIGTPLMVLAAVASSALAIVWLSGDTQDGLENLVFVCGAAFIGALATLLSVYLTRGNRPTARTMTPTEAPELHAIVERLSVLADERKPDIVLVPEAQPNSWMVTRRRARPRLHITEGLIERLEPAELQAVIAHEIAHLVNRDAAVMTVVSGPGVALRRAARTLSRAQDHRHTDVLSAIVAALLMFSWGVSLVGAAIGRLSHLGVCSLSRYRELAADTGAAVLTGRPAALASALVKISDGLAALPRKDLRSVAGRDPFHLLPVAGTANGWWERLVATHPPSAVRIERLIQLEREMQAARTALRVVEPHGVAPRDPHRLEDATDSAWQWSWPDER
jgi:heat shock protein HtpX